MTANHAAQQPVWMQPNTHPAVSSIHDVRHTYRPSCNAGPACAPDSDQSNGASLHAGERRITLDDLDAVVAELVGLGPATLMRRMAQAIKDAPKPRIEFVASDGEPVVSYDGTLYSVERLEYMGWTGSRYPIGHLDINPWSKTVHTAHGAGVSIICWVLDLGGPGEGREIAVDLPEGWDAR